MNKEKAKKDKLPKPETQENPAKLVKTKKIPIKIEFSEKNKK